MKVRSLKRIRGMAGTTVVVLVGALLVFNVAQRVIDPAPKTSLVAGADFVITGVVKASSCTGDPAPLYPGVSRCLVYTVDNQLTDPITVDALSLAMDPAFAEPAGCPSSNLDLTLTGFGGNLTVPAQTKGTVNETISLRNSGSDQYLCKNVQFHFRYSGHATYTHVYATNRSLVSSGSTSTLGQTVTFTATVTATGTPPNGPTGSVAFKDGATTIACESGSTTFNAGSATCKYTMNTTGTHLITAIYSNSDGNFTSGSSNIVSQQVNLKPTSSSLVSSLNPSVYGNNVSFTDTVTSTAGGTPAGSITFMDGATTLGTGTLNGSGQAIYATTALSPGTHSITAVYAGNATYATSTSNTVPQVVNYSSTVSGSQNGGLVVGAGQAVNVTSAGKLNGGATVKSGGILFFNGGTANGGITVESGGSLYLNGGTINGGISATGAKALTVCGASSINGGLSSSGATGFVMIGDAGDDGSPACAANTFSGNVTLTNNTAGVELGGNTINGTVTLTGNTVVGVVGENAKPEVEANKINGTLACSSNTPAPWTDGKPNTGSGSRTGQCAGF